MKKSFLFLANGFEEVEALAVVDVLRRGNVEINTVSITRNREVVGAHGIPVKADCLLDDICGEDADYLICPGGMPGSKNLGDCSKLLNWLQAHVDKGGKIAAICAAPALVLSHLKFSRQYNMTCYPGFESYLPGANIKSDGVVVDGNLITGRGPAYAFKFALAILEGTSSQVAKEVATGMLLL